MNSLKNNRGMTLIEILVVMAIMAALAGLIGSKVIDRLAQSKVDNTKTQISMLSSALELYKADNDYYPTTDQGLEALIEKPSSGNVPENYPSGGYLGKKKLPKDGWNKDFIYVSEEGETYTIMSYGADKKEGGSGRGADISSND